MSTPIAELIAVMARLRDRDKGCPWDIEQTFATIAPYTIEEAYEVADAIAQGDMAALQDELGDLLFQVVYHSRMAEEDGAFVFDDVASGITAKMIRRHPHVFGATEIASAEAQTGAWEALKARERAAKGAESVLAGLPIALPALTRALKLQNRAARVGFDWPDLAPVFAKLQEEVGELQAELAQADADRLEDEVGDILFVMANVARHLKVDPEKALRRANAKFERRFQFIEQALAEMGKTPSDSSLEEMDGLWDRAKAAGR